MPPPPTGTPEIRRTELYESNLTALASERRPGPFYNPDQERGDSKVLIEFDEWDVMEDTQMG